MQDSFTHAITTSFGDLRRSSRQLVWMAAVALAITAVNAILTLTVATR